MTAPSTDAQQQAANLLGALALRLSDELERAMTETSGLAESDAAAVSALHHLLDSPSVDLLARALGLSSSGAVRLVDRLEDAGLVRRSTAVDGRVTSVTLTAAGRRRAAAVTRARGELMEQALAALTASERRQFGELAGKILVGLIRPPGARRWTCRLCDVVACGRPVGRCPVYEAAKALYPQAAERS